MFLNSSEKRFNFFSKLCVILVIVIFSFDVTDGLYYGSWRKKKCHENPLDERQKQASVVLTGTVMDLFPDPKHKGMFKGEIEVKSIYKGEDVVKTNINHFRDHHAKKDMVMVEGFGDPKICVSKVRKRDTKVLLLTKGRNGELKLQSSILRINLVNLNHAVAAVKNIPYVPPAKPLEAHCRGHFCPFHAICTVHASNFTPYCACREHCPEDSLQKPVCGTDKQTYISACVLKKISCEQEKRLNVAYTGECKPCAGYRCEPPRVCQLDEQRRPVCRCEEACSDILQYVCGSDGQTYSNICRLKMQACKSMRNISMLHPGQCTKTGPCSTVICQFGERCQTDHRAKPRCVCRSNCQPEYKPVCGTDGITYDNPCQLEKQACTKRQDVSIKYQGRCTDRPDPCSRKPCRAYEICILERGIAICTCPQCSDEFNYVCGSDGKTYQNECKLREANCQTRQYIQKRSNGRCRSGCGSDRSCKFYGVCDTSGSEPECVCPETCEQREAPVCGSDGNTYRNECELRLRSCHTKTYLMIASIGECEICQGITCDYGARCENGKCVCPMYCPPVTEAICASDGNAYMNECAMKKRACMHNEDLHVVSRGPCEVIQTDLPEGSGGSGAGDCDESCSGECRYNHDDNSYSCVCDKNCPAVRATVCGSDGKTYGSVCQMEEEACRHRRELYEVSMDRCDDMSEEQCEGMPPLINPETDKDYLCSKKDNKCPEKSYCHLLNGNMYGKCCREDLQFDYVRTCNDSQFGCCDDNQTPASGPNGRGCPAHCRCYAQGSLSITCDPRNGQCTCKPGVTGKKCDTCFPGYWGLGRRDASEHGCIACNCNPQGRLRADCNQMTGECMCKTGVKGKKCDLCESGRPIGKDLCGGTMPMPRSCLERQCGFGGQCQLTPYGFAECSCEKVECLREDWSRSVTVCGSDGETYSSECALQVAMCRKQTSIFVVYQEPCANRVTTSDSYHNSQRRTPFYFTTTSPFTGRSRKTTRHLEPVGKVTKAKGVTQRPPLVNSGKILDICMDDSYCGMENSHCHLGICMCRENYIATLDNTHCSEVKISPTLNSSHVTECSYNPCKSGGMCIVDEALGYRCLCTFGLTGPNCRRGIDLINLPSFSGISYMQVRKFTNTNNLKFDISFKSLNKEGLILFSSQYNNGTGDFISFALKDGYVEFRYDLGSGMAVIRSSQEITLNREIKMLATLDRREGILMIDGTTTVTGMSPPSMTTLDLGGPVFLGYIPEKAKKGMERTGVDLGFTGCLISVKVKSSDSIKLYDLKYPQTSLNFPDVLEAMDIRECNQNPCHSMPCQHGGICLMSDIETYKCVCDKDFAGDHCEVVLNPCVQANCQNGATCRRQGHNSYECVCPDNREGDFCEYEKLQKIYVPEFNGSSIVDVPLEFVDTSKLSFKIWFLTKRPNGVLMYSQQHGSVYGGFISLNLVNRHVEFRFDNGGGTVLIRSHKDIKLNTWHEILITKEGRIGTLKIDSNSDMFYEGETESSINTFDLHDGKLYLGGFTRRSIPRESNINTNLTGVIQRIYINGQLIDNIMDVAQLEVNIIEYMGPPCNVNPCLNGGICVPKLNEADCKCPNKYIGLRCEKRADAINKDLPVKFDGETYLQYLSEITRKGSAQRSNKYELAFKLLSGRSGLMLFQQARPKSSKQFVDYFAVAVIDGYVEVSYNLGKQTSNNIHVIKSTVHVDDGNWHTLTVSRDERLCTLVVDNEREIPGLSDDGASELNTDGILWLGGKLNLPNGLPLGYYSGFMGCIDTLYINNKKLHMVDNRFHPRTATVRFCKSKIISP